MKIILKTPADQKEYVLAAGPERGIGLHMGPAGLTGNFPVLVQPKQYLGASFAAVENKGNMSFRMGFSVSVEFETLQAAEEYWFSYPITTPRVGSLRVQLILDNVTTTYCSDDVTIQDIAPTQNGVTIGINYTIMGGEIWLLN